MSEVADSSDDTYGKMVQKWGSFSTNQYRPLQASLELTYRCNERCTHCYIDDFSDDPNKKLDEEGWLKVIENLRSGGLLYLIFMGGEAMLNPYFWSILNKASELGFHNSMITNAIKIKDQSVADRLRDTGMHAVTFSLYSMNPQEHDAMTRVKGSHAKVLRAIEFCKVAGLEIALNTLLTKSNIEKIFTMYDWAGENDLRLKADVNVTPKFSGDLDPTRQRASEEQLKKYFRKMAERWPDEASRPSGEKLDSYICNAAKGKCAVTAYGELLPCIEIRESFGNLVHDNFLDIWQSEKANKWRGLTVRNIKGVDETNMELQNFCEHCPGLATHEHGDALEMTSFTKQVGKIKRDLWLERQKSVGV